MTRKEAIKELFRAAEEGDAVAARRAIVAGANVRARNDEDDTPLHYAAMLDSPEIARLLIAMGAEASAQNRSQTTPLHCAAGFGHINNVQLLLDNGAAVDALHFVKKTDIQ
jgi:ankyrin repeat protein